MSLFGNLGEDLLLNFQTACLEIWLFGNSGVKISFGNFVCQFCLEISFGNFVWWTDRPTYRPTERLLEAPSRSLKITEFH